MITTAFAGLTDIGRVRHENDDRWYAEPQQGLYLVADGMGGQSAGGLASKAVVEVLTRLLPERLGGDAVEIDQSAVDKVTAALVEVSNQLRVASFGHAGLSGMGSTVVLALISGQRMVVAHLGDSRAYLLHEHELRQLTTDHNLAQVLVDCHEITVEEAMHHPARAQLTRYVGMPEQALPESSICLISPGDRLLLCSDGLSSMVCNDQLRDILCKHNSPEQACQQLVDEANAAGGRDNITALVVTIGDAAHAGEPM